MEPQNNKFLHLTIKTKDGNVFDDNISALTSFNDIGVFDVLPLHANFISLIKSKIIVRKAEGNREFKIQNGVLMAHNNKVDIYLLH